MCWIPCSRRGEAVYFVDVVIDLILSVPNVLVTILIQETSMCIVWSPLLPHEARAPAHAGSLQFGEQTSTCKVSWSTPLCEKHRWGLVVHSRQEYTTYLQIFCLPCVIIINVLRLYPRRNSTGRTGFAAIRNGITLLTCLTLDNRPKVWFHCVQIPPKMRLPILSQYLWSAVYT